MLRDEKSVEKDAKKIKSEIQQFLENTKQTAAKPRTVKTSFKNPIAIYGLGLFNEKQLCEESLKLLQQCNDSASLFILEEHLTLLRNYFTTRKLKGDSLAAFYQTMTFEKFILRLFNKRYKEIYLDGRALVARDEKHGLKSNNQAEAQQLLTNIGTAEDKAQLFRKYLTLEEMMISPLVLPQVTSVVIGTGSRSPESKWDVYAEFLNSIDICTFSYPAAAEFRDGNTLHYDFLFLVKPEAGYSDQQKAALTAIKDNAALLTLATSIYGKQFAFNANESFIADFFNFLEPIFGSSIQIDNSSRAKSDDFVRIKSENGGSYLLHKQAYLNRTKCTLNQVLLAADRAMQHFQLGTTFQLKGLGLGAFAFNGAEAAIILEQLYIDALKEVLTENKLTYIKVVNLINLPTTFRKLNNQKKDEFKINDIEVFRTDMDPTSKENANTVGAIGGTVFCGDSGSQVGNEGNIGLTRTSSDDPATQYSLFNPNILNPSANKRLKSPECITVIAAKPSI